MKIEVHAACLTSNLLDDALARQFMELSTFICLTYHLSDKLKIRSKFSPMTHKLKALVSFVSFCFHLYIFKLISLGFFRKRIKSGKGCFCTTGICKCTVVFKLKIYNLQTFSRSSDIKCSFVCSNFVLFQIIRITEVYSESSQTSTMDLFAKIFKGFQLLTIFIKTSILDIRLDFEYTSE